MGVMSDQKGSDEYQKKFTLKDCCARCNHQRVGHISFRGKCLTCDCEGFE